MGLKKRPKIHGSFHGNQLQVIPEYDAELLGPDSVSMDCFDLKVMEVSGRGDGWLFL